MTDSITRRDFLRQSSALTVGLVTLGSAVSLRATKSPNEKVVVAIIGCNSRGMDHIAGYLALPNAEIGYVCDVDSRAVAKGVAAVAKKQQRKPQGVKDLRRILDNPDVDAISIAAPDHWHAPATILACAAGKHVYVEKPLAGNVEDCDLIAAESAALGLQVCVGHSMLADPIFRRTVNAVRMGGIGKLLPRISTCCVFCAQWCEEPRATDNTLYSLFHYPPKYHTLGVLQIKP